jgi:hypothetical protein
MGVNIESMFLVLATNNGLEIFFLVFLEINFHLQLDQYLNSSDLQIFDLVFRLIFYHNISQGVLTNKPDNSDGSRGQLTAGADTCHLLQIQSPWT